MKKESARFRSDLARLRNLLSLVLLALLWVSPTYSQTTDRSAYFKETYDLCRKQFLEEVQLIKERYEQVQVREIQVPGARDQELFVDICYIPPKNKSTKLLILTSGTHGVEGYVGHAVQELFIHEFLNPELIGDLGVLIIHGLNPYGFKHYRRVTENNVDLNRNSDIDPDLFKTVNSGYAELVDFLNPTEPVNTGSMHNRFFAVAAIRKILKASLPVLRQAVLQGQYQFPDGLYYGGQSLEPQIAEIAPLIKKVAEPYEKVLAIDLHTGYGERGKLHFFPNPPEDSLKKKQTEELFEGYSIDWGDNADFYTITGDFSGYIGKLIPHKDYIPMTFEYGTMDSQKTMGSIRSIHNMILENQGVHYGYRKEKDQRKVEKNLLEMYYPSDSKWRLGILDQTAKVFQDILEKFN